ncbi:MAG: adenosylmethionine--8-amino-7-oxononanoate transaminase [Balneolaceae bacterium]
MHPNVWHPFTIVKDSPDPLKVVRGDGIWLELEDGRKIVDCISSWWVNLHGHAHPDIAAAIAEQAHTLEHVIFSNFTHSPAEQLAEKLAAHAPGNLNRVFYSDNGSTAVEVALKLAIQYWRNSGEKRNRFLAFEGAYHGDTFGAMSAGARSVFSNVYADHLFDVDFVPYPDTWQGDETAGRREDEILEQIEQLLNRHEGDVAAIIIEPLVQGAGGMRMCRPEFLQKLHWVQRQYGTLLIFDEVMTGFGRTGDLFAALKAQVQPDLMCVAKGITGGFLPLSATLCTDELFRTFDSSDPQKTFWHGHSYTANPLGCAAALASFSLTLASTNQRAAIEEIHRQRLPELARTIPMRNRRITGTIAAFDMETNGDSGYLNDVANLIKKHSPDYGLLLRPLGDVLYLMPPYCIGDELHRVYDQMEKLLADIRSL